MAISPRVGRSGPGPLVRAMAMAISAAVAVGSAVVPAGATPAVAAAQTARAAPPGSAVAVPDDGMATMTWPADGLTPAHLPGFTTGTMQVATGDFGYQFVLRSDGTVWGRGRNDSGQLGDGTMTDRATPVQITGLTDVIQVSAGTANSMALRSDGTVWVWGDAFYGELGNGTRSQTPQLTPLQVPGLTGVAQIAAGSTFDLALMADHTVRAWGDNGLGELGTADPGPRLSDVPVPVRGLTGVRQISAGAGHGLALLTDGTLRAWGENESGQLGDGTMTHRHTPVTVLDLAGVEYVDGGWVQSLAVLSDGTVRSWGSNANGELGDGTRSSRSRPGTVSGLSGATRVSGGVFYGLALLADGTVRAWGTNSNGELGDGTRTSRLTPVTVPGLTHVSQISAGSRSLGIAADPAYSIAFAPPAGSVVAGSTLETPLIVTGLNGFTGSVTLAAAGLPAGVSFGPGQASTGGPATATFSTSASTPPGTYQITVTATNGTVFDQMKTATLALTVNPPPGFTLALSQPSGAVAAGETITTSVRLTPVSGFTGAAALTVSGLPAGVNASLSPGQVTAARPATLTLSTGFSAPTGTFGITVAGTNNTVFEPVKTVTYQLTVTQQRGFTLALSQPSGTVPAGASAPTAVSLAAVNGFTGAATLSAGALPAGVTASFDPGQVSVGNPATLTLSSATTAAPGTYQIAVTGTNNTVAQPVRTVTYQLTITPPPDFTIALSQSSATVAPGDSIAMSVSLDGLNGFTGPATLTAPNLPAGVAASFNPGQVSVGNPATLTLSTADTIAPGTFEVTVTATKNGVVRNATLALTVSGGPAPPDGRSPRPTVRVLR